MWPTCPHYSLGAGVDESSGETDDVCREDLLCEARSTRTVRRSEPLFMSYGHQSGQRCDKTWVLATGHSRRKSKS